MGGSLEVKNVSATGRDHRPRGRAGRMLIDTTTCIGCKACEVACVEWNDLHIEPETPGADAPLVPDDPGHDAVVLEPHQVQRDPVD
jgi:Fe-S-cluster-containing dehydrogenase component